MYFYIYATSATSYDIYVISISNYYSTYHTLQHTHHILMCTCITANVSPENQELHSKSLVVSKLSYQRDEILCTRTYICKKSIFPRRVIHTFTKSLGNGAPGPGIRINEWHIDICWLDHLIPLAGQSQSSIHM